MAGKERYKLSISKENSDKAPWERRFTYSGAVLRVVTAFILTCLCAFALIAYTPLRTFIPGYPDSRTRREALQNAIRIDSLENVISRWELYSENLRIVVEGGVPAPLDSIVAKAAEKKE